MSSPLLERRGRVEVSNQLPRIWSVPAHGSSAGVEAVELCRMAGLHLDPWQEFVLSNALGERADGKWAAFEVGLVVSRQNGKGSLLEARALAGLFLLGERLIVHSAHLASTAMEAFRRLVFLIEGCPELARRINKPLRSHGMEGIELKTGQRIMFRTRTKGAGRGMSGDCVILDEAMFLPEMEIAALLPTLSANANPQVWYTGSAPDQNSMPDSVVLARVRERGMRGGDPSLAYFEWSVDCPTPDDVTPEMATDPESWAQSNPALDIRIRREYVENEQRAMDARTFAVERLGVGDWPRTDGAESIIGMGTWDELADATSVAVDPVWFAVDVSPNRGHATISAASRLDDGRLHVEVVDRKNGTDWLAGFCARLQAEHKPLGFLADDRGPVASLIPELKQAGVDVETLNATDHAQACGFLIDQVNRSIEAKKDGLPVVLVHRGQAELRAAIKGASTRPLGDAWAWSRKNSHVDISPLVSCTLALWGFGRDSGEVDAWCAAW